MSSDYDLRFETFLHLLFHVCFASSVCFTQDLAHLKKKSSLVLPEIGVTILVKGNTSICLTVLSLELNV